MATAPLKFNTYDPTIEAALLKIERLLSKEYHLSKRAIALLLLQGDEEIEKIVADRDRQNFKEIQQIVTTTQANYKEPLHFVLSLQRQNIATQLSQQVIMGQPESKISLSERISRLTIQPITGIPILLLVLYYGLYQFVGVFGAGTIVDYLETNLFENIINPWINKIVESYIPWVAIQELLAKDYGILTLALRYAIAIVLPIVGTFFIVFSIIEDTGYLPRLSLLVDRLFKGIGLNGRAVIPMTLGFGCGTMATMVTRTLETTRERVIATLLLALAVPCSAQLGVIMAVLAGRPGAIAVWSGFILLIFLLIGWLTAKLLPGERPTFYMELPPLRWPNWRNVLTKTYTRMQWYLLEVLPLFILASVLIWAGNITGIFQQLIAWLAPMVNWLGLPDETAQIFLFGFFRRDYGAAGLFDLYQTGGLTGTQLVVTAATLTLFVPCIAQFIMMIKERGFKTAVAIAAFIFPFAFLAGFVLNWLINLTGLKL
ncbi:MAG: ferrous iron transporter B [Firmicutes bacterium]|nr:ferrous iron transporter B [Bacillota bacterium]